MTSEYLYTKQSYCIYAQYMPKDKEILIGEFDKEKDADRLLDKLRNSDCFQYRMKVKIVTELPLVIGTGRKYV